MPLLTPTNEAGRSRRGQPAAAATPQQAPTRSQSTLFASLHALFNGRWRPQRRGSGLHLVAATSARPVALHAVPPSRGAALRHDHQRLSQWLRDHADLCHSLRHLACLEQTLARQGSLALRTMPQKVLGKALEQLQGLTRDDPDFVLPELQRRLRATVATVHERVSPFELTEAMAVSEASHSLFDEMERSWSGCMPQSK